MQKEISVIGLGYVGLPLAVEFGKIRKVIGFDLNKDRINELKKGIDQTLEVSSDDLTGSKDLFLTSNQQDIENSQIYIIAVPTPIDTYLKPDLSPLIEATKMVAKYLSRGDIVIYESTVYPGATEEVCVPLLEEGSSLIFNKDFFCGYSPERVNPGDKEHKLQNISKVTSGSNEEISIEIDNLYKEIIVAGTHRASSIKVAEAAKVIENTQRDVNIALINELALIFNKLEIDTEEVLQAAGTKWNFLPFKPGLVGGHCIGVDPYYLTYKSIEIGYNPEIILAGRRLNDNMSKYIIDQITLLASDNDIYIGNSNVLIMGLSFKENCPDIRNTKVIDIYNQLKKLNAKVDIFDPWVIPGDAKKEFNIDLIDSPDEESYDIVIIAVQHDAFFDMGIKKIKSFGKPNNIIYDIKHIFHKELTDGRL